MFATSLKNEENLRRKTPFQVLVVAGLWVGSKGPTSLAAFHLKEISDVARFSLPFLVLAEQIGRDFLGAWDFKGRDWLIDRVRRRKVGKVHAKIRCQLFTLPYPESINKEGGAVARGKWQLGYLFYRLLAGSMELSGVGMLVMSCL